MGFESLPQDGRGPGRTPTGDTAAPRHPSGTYGARMFRVPEAFGRSTVEREGERGAAWLAELPSIVEELVDRWGCTPDGEVMHGGVGVVVPVRRGGAEGGGLEGV